MRVEFLEFWQEPHISHKICCANDQTLITGWSRNKSSSRRLEQVSRQACRPSWLQHTLALLGEAACSCKTRVACVSKTCRWCCWVMEAMRLLAVLSTCARWQLLCTHNRGWHQTMQPCSHPKLSRLRQNTHVCTILACDLSQEFTLPPCTYGVLAQPQLSAAAAAESLLSAHLQLPDFRLEWPPSKP